MSPTFDRNPFLYILMRTDMASMNPGKAIAQGAHAANQFTMTMRAVFNQTFPVMSDDEQTISPVMFSETGMDTSNLDIDECLISWEMWEKSAISANGYMQGFGTTITLDISSEKMLFDVVDAARKMGFPAEVTFDPSYPLVDGNMVHLIPLHTCGYVFGDKSQLSPLLSHFNLHP